MKEIQVVRTVTLAVLPLALGLALFAYRALPADDVIDPEPGGATFVAAPTGDALIVTSLRSDGIAQRAGLRVGDLVETIDGHAARSFREVEQTLATRHYVTLHVRRGPAHVDINLTMGARTG
jgi:S1-C subfamily serine protease